jgi:virginiamycin B lyase
VRRLVGVTAAALLVAAGTAQAAASVREFPLPTAMAQPQDIVQGPDGNMWFAERGINKIGRISGTSPGAIQEFDIAAGATSPDIITVGPDGKLWYTEAGGIGVMTPGPAPSAGTIPATGLGLGQARGIAVGPDGNVWVSDATNIQVIIVSPVGTRLDAVSLPTGFNARNITRGPDGNIWVADFTTMTGRIARIKVAGTTRTLDPPNGFPTPGGVNVMDVIAGKDGNIWYTAQGTTVGRMTPAGVAKNFTSKGVDPFGITLGPDGAVWFGEFQGNAIGRVGYDGVTSHVTGLTPASGPRYAAGGPGNTLWFTEDTGNRVGRVSGIPLLSANPPPADTVRPRVTDFSLSRKRFRLGGRGTRIRFTLSEDATVTIRFARRVNGHWRRVRRKLRFESTAGAHRRRFRGRFDRKHALRPGRYRMTLRARDAAGNVSAAHRARFRLLPRR